MRTFKSIIFVIVFCASITNLVANQNATNKDKLTAFAMMPPLTVLLEILYPQGMIGLNYEPYSEDKEFMPQNVAKLPVIGMQKGKEPIFEKLIALNPSVIFFNIGTDKKILESYAKFGIKTIEVDAFNEKKLNETIQVYGIALGVENRANELLDFINATNAKIESLSAKITHRPKVYFAQGVDGLSTQCSKEGDKSDLAYRIGGINAINCGNGFAGVNFEILARENPQIIFVREIALYKQLRDNPPKQWQNIDAIKNKRIYYAPSTPSNWLMKPPSVMQTIGIPYAFAKVQNELLSEDEARKIAQDFFKKFLRELSDKDYRRISGE